MRPPALHREDEADSSGIVDHGLCALQEFLLLVRTHSIQPTRKGSDHGQQVRGQFLLWCLLFLGRENRERYSETVKQGLQILLSQTRQPVARRHGNFSHPVFTDHLEQPREVLACGREARTNIGEDQRFAPRSLGLCPHLQAFYLRVQVILLSLSAYPPIEHQKSL